MSHPRARPPRRSAREHHVARGTIVVALDPSASAMGERDGCQDLVRELAAFQSARDRSLLVVPRMAHRHNFAGTRLELWRRTHAFVAQVATPLPRADQTPPPSSVMH